MYGEIKKVFKQKAAFMLFAYLQPFILKKNMLKKKPLESKDELFTNQCVILKKFQSRL